jgi:hypothetical protein
MTRLQPVRGRPGEYVNPEWEPNEPGTFAVVIGVSAYRHLAGGEQPVAQNYGLGQLHVSAATAHRFFRWLQDECDYPEASLARCWLVLAPTEQELSALEGDEFAEATLAGCRSAIGSWVAAMAQLPRASAERSRGVLFFSGHGLEVWQDKQILLPTDYLNPPLFNVNDAMSTANLRFGLAASPVTNHYLFVDACRNDVDELRLLNVEGQRILNEPLTAAINRDTVVATLYAAASGTETWQPRELEQGYSVFGGALMDGLQGQEGLELKGCTSVACQVHFHPLETFVKARMGTVLASFQSQQKVRVRAHGSAPDGWITAVPAPSAAGAPPVASVTPVLEASYEVRNRVRWGVTEWWGTGHAIFGSERMTDVWQSARVVDLNTGLAIPSAEIVVTAVDRSENGGTFRVTLELPASRRGYWLELKDATAREFACVLPADNGAFEAPLFEFDVDQESSAPGEPYRPTRITRLEARLSPHTPGPAGVVARIWRTYETHNAAAAAAEMNLVMLEELVRGRMRSPLSAAVAATILLRVRRLDLLHETWLRNLSDWFEDLPDGLVLWSEQLRLASIASAGSDTEAEQVLHLSRLADRGLPMLSEVLPMSERQLALLPHDPPSLTGLRSRLREAMRHYRPGGTFAVFSGPSGTLAPSLIL